MYKILFYPFDVYSVQLDSLNTERISYKTNGIPWNIHWPFEKLSTFSETMASFV